MIRRAKNEKNAKDCIGCMVMGNVNHVDDAVKAAGVTLTNDEISRLESMADKANVSTIREWEKKME